MSSGSSVLIRAGDTLEHLIMKFISWQWLVIFYASEGQVLALTSAISMLSSRISCGSGGSCKWNVHSSSKCSASECKKSSSQWQDMFCWISLTSSLRFLRLRTVFSLISQRTEKRLIWKMNYNRVKRVWKRTVESLNICKLHQKLHMKTCVATNPGLTFWDFTQTNTTVSQQSFWIATTSSIQLRTPSVTNKQMQQFNLVDCTHVARRPCFQNSEYMPENSAGFILWQFNVCFLACKLKRSSTNSEKFAHRNTGITVIRRS